MLIKEEWERDQRKLQEAEEIRKKAEDEKKRKQVITTSINAFLNRIFDLDLSFLFRILLGSFMNVCVVL